MIKCRIFTAMTPAILEHNVNMWMESQDYGIYNQSLGYSMKNGDKAPYMMSVFYETEGVVSR